MNERPRFAELLPFWSWLPAFRAVAETEHLPTAARLCGVGPSTLSRTLSLLERALSRQLFDRDGRSLRLNDRGRELLDAVQKAMRLVDDGVEALRSSELRGPLTIASGGAGTTALVAPALEQLRVLHPGLEPRLVTRDAAQVADALLRGELDVAFQEMRVERRGLVALEVGRISRGVYCGARHPLFGAAAPGADDVAAAEFVAPPADHNGAPVDGWPAALPRHVAVIADQLRVGLEFCAAQALLAVLPDALAAARGGALRRLDAVPIPDSPVFAIHRKALTSRPSAATALVELVGAATGSRPDPRPST